MEIIFMLIAFSILIAGTFLGYFIWAVRSGQYDDNYTPAVRMLMDGDFATEAAAHRKTKLEDQL